MLRLPTRRSQEAGHLAADVIVGVEWLAVFATAVVAVAGVNLDDVAIRRGFGLSKTDQMGQQVYHHHDVAPRSGERA